MAMLEREKEEEQRRQEQLDEQRRREAFLHGRASTDDVMDLSYEGGLSPEELALIKERHLGGSKKGGKKLKRFGDRRNLFDWDAEDDTSEAITVPTRQLGRAAPLRRQGDDDESSVHWTRKGLAQMKERDWRILREDFNISTQGGKAANPIRYWEETEALGRRLQETISRLGYKDPTPIQRQAIPIALQKRDLLGVAETGSGKTLAFLIPMLSYISALPKLTEASAADGPYGLILAPTRELAQQIERVASSFCSRLGYSSLAIIGGHSVSEQSIMLRRGVEIVIATPGRLRDCLEQHVLVLNQCYSLVLDEADRMIDMNYEEDLRFILECLPAATTKPDTEVAEDPSRLALHRYRQTTMFSATMPPSVEKLAKLYLRRPVIVKIGEVGGAVDRISQRVELIQEHEKPNRLLPLLEKFPAPIIIFVNQKTTVDALHNRLSSMGFRPISLHGGKGQEQREAAISQLRSGSKDILIATDVASRGLDIDDVSLVVNYDMAKSIEDYVHRIGRTGRAGKEGTAVAFLTEKDSEVFYDLRVLLQKSPNTTVPADFSNHEAARTKPGAIQQKRRHEERISAFGV